MATILLVLAHPDDESFVGGGALAHYSRAGHTTALLCLTDGQAGRMGVEGKDPEVKREELGKVRRRELQAAARVLRIDRLFTPGLPDGKLGQIPDEQGIGVVSDVIDEVRPQVMLSFGPEGGGSGHPDHVASWRWSHAAFDCKGGPVEKYYWITWPPQREVHGTIPTCVVELGVEVVELKRRAFSQHRTQQDHLDLYEEVLAILAGTEQYHLAKSRLALPPLWETDLLHGIG